MNLNAILKEVNSENIYKTIIELEGPKYPLDNLEALNEACDYIFDKLQNYGIKTEIHEFYVAGMDVPFKNVIGYVGDISNGATLIGSHYDTVRDTPGANDNLSSVAVTLEIARILGKLENPPAVVFGIFTLEEGHPGIAKALEEKLIKNKLIDERFRPYNASFLKQRKFIVKERRKRVRLGQKPVDACISIKNECTEQLTPDGLIYLNILIDVYTHFYSISSEEKLEYPIGSYEFVEKMKSEKINIKQVIVYDCLGWIKEDDYSQHPLPINRFILQFAKRHKINLKKSKGNYIGVIGSKTSSKVFNAFLKNCKEIENDLPYLGVKIPLEFKDMKKKFPDMLRSDHAAFWKENIPGLFISDLANFRSDFYHTPADTSEHLDYDALKKVAEVTLKTVLEEI